MNEFVFTAAWIAQALGENVGDVEASLKRQSALGRLEAEQRGGVWHYRRGNHVPADNNFKLWPRLDL